MELGKHEARNGRVAAFLRQSDQAELGGQFVHRHGTRDQPGAVGALDGVRLLALGLESADDGFEHVGGRDEPFEMAVFVMDERDGNVGFLQDAEGVERVHGFRDDRHLADVGADVERRASERSPPEASRARTTPIRVSMVPSPTGMSECGVSMSCWLISSSGVATSSHSTSVRGVIRPTTVRSASRMTPEIISRSWLSMTPAASASTMSMEISSSDTWLSLLFGLAEDAEHEAGRGIQQPDGRTGDAGECRSWPARPRRR